MAVTLLVAGSSVAQIPVHSGTNVLMLGDSLTAEGWFWSQQSQVGGTSLLVDQLSPLTAGPRAATAVSGRATVTGSRGSAIPVAIGGQINAINQGHGQKKIGDALANYSTWVLPFNPQVLVIEFGRNDVNPPLSPFTPTTLVSFRSSYDSVLSQAQTDFPGLRIVCLSIFTDGEEWVTSQGVPAWNNAFDPVPGSSYTPSIAEFGVQIGQSCASHGGTYVDMRPTILEYEAAHNLPEPGTIVGPLTQDATHPNALGQQIMSNLVVPALMFSP